MASIAEWIQKIKTAIYGEEVRGAIWQSLQAMNDELTSADVTQIPVNKADIANLRTDMTSLQGEVETAGAEVEGIRVGADGTVYPNAGEAVRTQITDLKADLKSAMMQVVCPNLMGMKNWVKYPVDFSGQRQLTISTSDGSVFPSDSELKILFYNKDGNILDSGWKLSNGQTYRTITLPESYPSIIKYLAWNGSAESSVPLMVNYGATVLDYVEYEEPIREVLKTKVDKTVVDSLSNSFYAYTNNNIRVQQGKWSTTDGIFSDATDFCSSIGIVPINYVLMTKQPLRMYLIAYDKITGEFAGSWNGETFTNQYSENGWLYNIDISEWSEKYTNYNFKVDFYNYQTLTPSDVYNSLVIYTKEQMTKEYDIVEHLDGWEIGSFDGAVPSVTDKRIRHIKTLHVMSGSIISTSGTDVSVLLGYYDELGNKLSSSGWQSNIYINSESYIRILLKKNDESVITLEDLKKVKLRLVTPKTPNVHIRVVPQYSIGDCMIFRSNDKTMLIDTGRSQDYNRLKNGLSYEGVTKIDYVLVSHYHSDHISVETVTNLISDYDLSSCKFILPPPIPDTYNKEDEPDIYNRQNEIITLLKNNNIAYINTYDYDMRNMWLCGISFDFYNLNHDDWYAQSADYNQMSLVCIANIGKTSIMFTGDMGQPLETKLLPLINRTVDVAKFGHHGLNATMNTAFWHKVKPNVFFSCSPEVWHDELYLSSHQIRFANYNGIKNIMTNTSGTIIIDADNNGYGISGYNYMLDNLSSSEFFDYVI